MAQSNKFKMIKRAGEGVTMESDKGYFQVYAFFQHHTVQIIKLKQDNTWLVKAVKAKERVNNE